MATLKDIAKQMEVSPSTVSRALHNHPGISDGRKKAIRELADLLDYQPDIIAQSLKNQHTSTIGVILPEIKHHFFAAALDGIEEVAYKAGYTIIVSKSNENYEREVLNTRALVSNRIAGLIISVSQETQNSEHFLHLQKNNIPIVFFDRVPEGVKANIVNVDDYGGAFLAVEHLIKRGYRRIAHLAGPKHLWNSKERLRGYQDALRKHKVRLNKEFVIHGGFWEKDGADGFSTLLNKNGMKPDAVFAVNDPVALGVLLYCKKMDIAVPDEVAIVGFSDNPISSLVEPALTTVAQPAIEIGKRAAEVLLRELTAPQSGKPVMHILDTQLIVRERT